jgi:hypothetical protein
MTGFRENDSRPYVFVSNDTGRTWRSIAANLPLEAVNVIKEDPVSPDILYVGTDLGVYVSRSRGAQWESLNATLPSTPVQDLTVQSRENELVIGTYGRGAWILDLTPIRDARTVAPPAALRLLPIRSVTREYYPWETVPGDRRGRRVARMQLTSESAGVASVTVSDSVARVVRRFTAPVSRGVSTLVWDLQVERQAGGLVDAPAGRFTVEVTVGTLRTTGELQVLEDPILTRKRADAPRP